MIKLTPIEIETVLRNKHKLLNMAQDKSLPLKIRDAITKVLGQAIEQATIDVQDFKVKVQRAENNKLN